MQFRIAATCLARRFAIIVVMAIAGTDLPSARADDAPADPAIKIDKSPAAISHKTFDPDHQPSEMPKLTPPEAAVTTSHTGCSVEISASVLDHEDRGNGRCLAKVRVDSVVVKTFLDVTVWLPTRVTPKIKDHEEGHRDISERFYKTVEKVATDLARPYIGRTLQAEGKDCDAAADAAIKSAIDQIAGDFMAKTEVPASKAQQIYDEITRHGTNRVREQDAIRQAIAKATADPSAEPK